MPYATGAMPYADGGVVDDALRLANQGKYRLHQTIARHGYATDGEVKPEEPQVEAHGDVQFAPEYMPRPTEQVQQPNEASSQAFIHEGLKGSAPQYDPTVERGIGHGLTAAAKWTPPGAVADAAGLLGGPSLYQNVKEGRYMPAALQVASVGLPAALAGRAAIAAGLGAGASKFTKLGKPDAYGMPGYIGYQTAEDWGPGVLGKETYEGAKKAGKAALEKGTSYIKSKFGYADGGEVEDALRLARSRHKYATDGGVPDEGGQREFLKESLKDSAPQYVESQDFPARAERAVQSVDKTAGAANNLLAKAFSVPEARSPEGRSAKEIVESAIPQDPNQISKQAMQQWQSGDKVGAVETMAGGMPQTGAIRAYHYSPNAFEKFDTSKIGQGGAGGSSFGHGLYFGSKEDDARMWQRRVNEDRGLPKQSGHVYEANLDLDPNKIIDYNKYLHEQPEFVKDALINKLGYEKSMFANPSEGHFAGYPRGDMAVPKSEGAMKSWRDAGLQGVQYYDPNNSYRGYVSFVDEPISILRRYAKGGKTPAWTRAEGKDPEGGLNSKGRASAKAEGHNLKPPQPEGGPRRDSFCSRMTGMKKKLTSAKTANDPDSRINKSLRAWNCADGGAVDDAMRLAKGGEVWEKPRPKSLGKPKHLSESQKASAKASAKAAGRPYPNWVDNANAAKKANK
jgi:hypothetical protein